MSDKAFFQGKRAAAVLKHGILSKYMPPFVAKTGSTSTDRRVVVLDGYAGEGRYADGSEGSPIFMANTARILANMTPPRKMELFFVEAKQDRFEKLRAVLTAEASDISWTAQKGTVETHLDQALQVADGVPFFAFLDPCGIGLVFDDIVDKIFARPAGQFTPATEILLNFSHDAVRRIGGRLTKEEKGAVGRSTTLARMDAACGGRWWRRVYRQAANPEEGAAAVVDTYTRKLLQATGAAGWKVPVRNAQHHQTKYSLIFVTRHRDGEWLFGEAVSGAQKEWREAIFERDNLFGTDEHLVESETALAAGWISEIKKNIRNISDTTAEFRLEAKYAEVLGGAVGLARSTHMRTALKQLHGEGFLSSDGKGDLQRHRVVRA